MKELLIFSLFVLIFVPTRVAAQCLENIPQQIVISFNADDIVAQTIYAADTQFLGAALYQQDFSLVSGVFFVIPGSQTLDFGNAIAAQPFFSSDGVIYGYATLSTPLVQGDPYTFVWVSDTMGFGTTLQAASGLSGYSYHDGTWNTDELLGQFCFGGSGGTQASASPSAGVLMPSLPAVSQSAMPTMAFPTTSVPASVWPSATAAASVFSSVWPSATTAASVSSSEWPSPSTSVSASVSSSEWPSPSTSVSASVSSSAWPSPSVSNSASPRAASRTPSRSPSNSRSPSRTATPTRTPSSTSTPRVLRTHTQIRIVLDYDNIISNTTQFKADLAAVLQISVQTIEIRNQTTAKSIMVDTLIYDTPGTYSSDVAAYLQELVDTNDPSLAEYNLPIESLSVDTSEAASKGKAASSKPGHEVLIAIAVAVPASILVAIAGVFLALKKKKKENQSLDKEDVELSSVEIKEKVVDDEEKAAEEASSSESEEETSESEPESSSEESEQSQSADSSESN